MDIKFLLLMMHILFLNFANAFLSSEICSINNTMNNFRIISPKNVFRKKRSLIFPKGSNFVLTMSLLKAIQVREPTNWNLDLEFDMTWPIPVGVNGRKSSLIIQKPFQPHRRHRRDLYTNFEMVLDSQGLPGNQCILHTICEAKFILNPPGISLIEDILRVIFSYPGSDIFKYDIYDKAYLTKKDCDIMYNCPLSILNLLLNFNDHVLKYY